MRFATSRRPGPFLLATALVVIGHMPADAATSHVGHGLLTIVGGDGPDHVRVTCPAGNVLINGSDPGTGPSACADIQRIAVHLGAGHDNANLSAIDATEFPALEHVGMRGGADPDRLSLPQVGAIAVGGGGNDLISVGAGNDAIGGGSGSDEVRVVANTDVTLTDSTSVGDGNDSLISVEEASVDASGPDPVTLDASAATISTTLVGGDGNDTLIGGFGTDVLRGSSFLSGSQGSDHLEGGPGKDVIEADRGDDSIDGGPGSDLLDVAQVAPTMTLTDSTLTGAGTDALLSIERASMTFSGHQAVDFDASGFSGPAQLRSWNGEDTLIGGPGPNVIDGKTHDDTLRGGGGHDVILGGYDYDSLSGGPGRDELYGGRGNDLLSGNDGRDLLVGGTGVDRLNGGSSPDVLRTNDGYPDDVAHGAAGDDKCFIDRGDLERSCERGGVVR